MTLTIPPYVPPVTGAGTLNAQKELSRQVKTIAAASTTIPIVYGEAQVGGRIFAATFTGGYWYIGALFCVGEIDSFTALYLNGVDVKTSTPAGMTITYYTGTTSQTADATLASAISGYVDTLVITNSGGSVGIAYVVLKYNESHYSGFPTITAKIKGRKVRALSENLLSYSEQLDQAATWVQTADANIDVTANAIAAPDGNTTADKITEASTASVTRWIAQTLSTNPAENSIVVLSGYFKAAERTDVRLIVRTRANTTVGATFNLSTGTVSGTSTFDAGISLVGNGWYRCWVAANVSSGATVVQARVQMATGTTYTYAGTIGSGFYAWGLQLERKPSIGVYSSTTTAASAAAWSDNPARCARDLILDPVFGLGEDVDDLSALCAANECDALVTTEKRRTLNLVIDSARSATDWIQTLATYAGAFIYAEGGRWTFKPDRPAYLWQFTASDDGWTATNGTTALTAAVLQVTQTAADLYLVGPSGLNICGSSHRFVRVRLWRSSGSGTVALQLFYKTDRHAYNLQYRGQVSWTSSNNQWVIVEFDMHSLYLGGDDWKQSIITQLRLDLTEAAGTDAWSIDWISVGVEPITTADVVAGSFQAGTADSGQMPTVLRIDYTDTSTTEYKTRPAYAELTGVSTGAVPRRESVVQLPGVTRYSQAYREAAERLAKLNNSLYCEFTRFDEGLTTGVGDMLTVMHPYVDTAASNENDAATLFRVVDAKTIGPGRVRVRATAYDSADYDDTENTTTWGAYTRRAGNLNGSGDGINRIQPRFAGAFASPDYDGQFAVAKGAAVNLASVVNGIAPDPTAGYYGAYAIKIGTASSGTDRTIWFGSSSTDYTMPLDPNSKWLFSCKFWPSSVPNTSVSFTLKTSSGTSYTLTDTSSTVSAWNDFVDTATGSNLLNLVNDSSGFGIAALSVNRASSYVWFDGLMLEKQVGEGAIVSPWKPPLASSTNPARISPRLVSPGTLDKTVAIDDGNGNSRNIVAGVLSGTVADGVSVTFTPSYARVPTVSFNPTALTYNSGYSAASHALVCEARSLTTSGFTAYIKVRQLVTTITARTDTTPTDNGALATPRYTIQKAASASEAWDDRYKFNFDATVKNIRSGEPGWAGYEPGQMTVSVYIATADSGSPNFTPTWTLVGSVNVNGLGGSTLNTTRTGLSITVVRDGLTQRGGTCPEFGISITSEVMPGGSVTFTSVTYETATSLTETSATAAGFAAVPYTVIPT